MAITVSTLEGLDPNVFHSLGFHRCASSVTDAAESFHTDVRRVVDAGHAWTGEGQPQAATVMETNALALQVAHLQMQAGVAATNGLVTALLKAKTEMRELRATRYQPDGLGGASIGLYEMDIAEDGTVTWSRPPLPVPYLHTAKTFEDEELTRRAQEILAYAEFADLTAAGLLDRITNIAPRFTETTDPVALTYNLALRDLAATAVLAAKLSETLWDQFAPGKWEFDTSDAKQELLELHAQFTNGTTSGGWLLTGWGTGAIAYGLPIAPTPLGLLSIAAGALSTLAGGAWILYDTITGDDEIEKGPPGIEEPTNLLGVPTDVNDAELQELLDELYLDSDHPVAEAGFTTVMDAALLQRAGVPDLPVGEDYLGKARELRDELDNWLDSSYSELSDDVTPRFIRVEASNGSTTTTYTVEAPRTLEYYDKDQFAVTPEERQLARRHRNQLTALLGDD